MRRIAVVLAVLSLLVFGLGLSGNADSARSRDVSREDLLESTTPLSDPMQRKLDRIRAMAPAPDLCTKKQLNRSINQADIDTFGDCMIQLQDFAHYTQNELTQLNKFVTKFFNCTSYAFVTRYGEDPLGGTFGYVWQNPDTSQFLTTALDFVVDPTTEPFLNFYFVKQTDACIAFAQ
jgi:hypothetical protein